MQALLFASVSAVLSFAQLQALEIPSGGSGINDGQPLQASLRPEVGRAEALGAGKRITVTRPDATKPYLAQCKAPLLGMVATSERVLVLIKARGIDAESQGMVQVKLQLNEAPYTAFGASVDLTLSDEWSELPVVFVANADIPSGKGAVAILCGKRAQTIEIESVRVLKYPATLDLAALPRIQRSYPGREPDAPWRKAALDRIEQHRKADLALTLTGADGKPLANTAVKLRLSQHEFGFGTCVSSHRIAGQTADDQQYRDLVQSLFSIVVFENNLKDSSWKPEVGVARRALLNAELDSAFTWLAGQHIAVRGHYLMQVARPPGLAGMDDAAAVRERILNSVRERLAFVQDRVCEWDVINHPIAWPNADLLNKHTGLEDIDREVFKLGRSLTKLPFFVNENQIFRPGPQHDDTFTYIKALNAAGFTVAGLGNQAHFQESWLPSPEHLLAVTDHFATIVPQQAITEFDVTTADEDLAADYTRDVLIATFSHPAYQRFMIWGLWEGEHYKPEAAPWRKDWTPRKRGAVLEEWIGTKWRTEVSQTTDAAGKVSWRGFPGWYEVQAAAQTQQVSLTKAKPVAAARL